MAVVVAGDVVVVVGGDVEVVLGGGVVLVVVGGGVVVICPIPSCLVKPWLKLNLNKSSTLSKEISFYSATKATFLTFTLELPLFLLCYSNTLKYFYCLALNSFRKTLFPFP